MIRVRFTERAADQLEQALASIERDNPYAAVRIGDRIRATLSRLQLFPESGSPTDDPGIRYAVVPRTRYLLFYDVDPLGVRVIRVRHASRRTLHRR